MIKTRVGISFWSIRGKIIPPMLPAVMAIPVAVPRLRRKKWPMLARAGVFIGQPPNPFRSTLYTIMKCQYLVHKPSNIMEAGRKTLPPRTRSPGP